MAKREDGKPEESGPSAAQISGSARAFMSVMQALSSVADQLGVPTAVFVLLMLAIWKFGKEDTQDKFIQWMLFGVEEGSFVIRGFFLALIFAMIIVGMLRRREIKVTATENNRLRTELDVLQKKMLEPKLAEVEPTPIAVRKTPIQTPQTNPPATVAIVK